MLNYSKTSVFLLILLAISCTPKKKEVKIEKNKSLFEKGLVVATIKGKKIVINYWATWCGPCIKEMPSIKRAEEILEDFGYTFLLVSDETISKISKFKNDRNFDFNFLKSIKSYESLGIYSLPTSYIFDENGRKVETIVGTIAWDSEQTINKLKLL